jgi:hypothetical protein
MKVGDCAHWLHKDCLHVRPLSTDLCNAKTDVTLFSNGSRAPIRALYAEWSFIAPVYETDTTSVEKVVPTPTTEEKTRRRRSTPATCLPLIRKPIHSPPGLDSRAGLRLGDTIIRDHYTINIPNAWRILETSPFSGLICPSHLSYLIRIRVICLLQYQRYFIALSIFVLLSFVMYYS